MKEYIRIEDIITIEEIKETELEYQKTGNSSKNVCDIMVAEKVVNNTFKLLLDKLEDPKFGIFPQDKLARLIDLLESGV